VSVGRDAAHRAAGRRTRRCTSSFPGKPPGRRHRGSELGKEPEITFQRRASADRSGPSSVQVRRAAQQKIERHGVTCWLVNTGWVGGPYGVGKRISIRYTRALLNAARSGRLDKVRFTRIPSSAFEMPTECPDVPAEVLNPRPRGQDKKEYDRRYRDLAMRYQAELRQVRGRTPARWWRRGRSSRVDAGWTAGPVRALRGGLSRCCGRAAVIACTPPIGEIRATVELTFRRSVPADRRPPTISPRFHCLVQPPAVRSCGVRWSWPWRLHARRPCAAVAVPTPESGARLSGGRRLQAAPYDESIVLPAPRRLERSASGCWTWADVQPTAPGRWRVISSPGNLANLERLRDIAQKLAHPAGTHRSLRRAPGPRGPGIRRHQWRACQPRRSPGRRHTIQLA